MNNRNRGITPIGLGDYLLILRFAQQLHKQHHEPIPDMSIDSPGKVQSSLQTPFATYGGVHLYKTFNGKASALFYFLVKNHCLPNGNKRMAILTLALFIFVNKRNFHITDNQLYALAKSTAKSTNKDKAIRKVRKTLQRTVRRQNIYSRKMTAFGPRKRRKLSLIRRVVGDIKKSTFFAQLNQATDPSMLG